MMPITRRNDSTDCFIPVDLWAMRIGLLFALTLLPLSAEKQIDLVKLGHDTFHAVGCAECHSEIKNDTSVKTGPGLYGLFQKEARKREVISGGEEHRQQVTADLKYLTSSLRRPHEDRAIAENGATKGEAYLPIMPPYDASFISNFKAKAIFQYLLTLNDKGKRGPATLMEKDKGEKAALTAEQDAGEILVTDRTRIYRARVHDSSVRSVFVGMPSGLNYNFDPVSLSIERIWWGGFLNITEEQTGRGGKASRLGQNALEVHGAKPLLAPIDPKTSEVVDLSFKSPRLWGFDDIAKNLHGDLNFSDQLKATSAEFRGYHHAETPTFHYAIGKNEIDLQFKVNSVGEATILLSGTLDAPQTFAVSPFLGKRMTRWTVDKLPAQLTFKVPIQKAWRPKNLKTISGQQIQKFSNEKVRAPKGYAAEQIAAPKDIHGRDQLFEPMGMATAPNDQLIVTTRTAGVWKIHNQKWTLIAEGLLDSLGLVVEEDGSLIVGQKPELTRLSDVDGDGWFEHYETLSDDFLATGNYHEYLHGPAKGADGNYYIQLNLAEHRNKKAIYKAGGKWMGAQGGYRGWSLQVTPKGGTTPYARGLRSPAGLAKGPNGKLYYTENQGEYVGTSKLFMLEKGRFYGHPGGLVDLAGMKPSSKEIQWDQVKGGKEKAIALMAHSRLANSPGSPAWANSAFGEFEGQMFVGDQTLSTLFRILPKENYEAAIIPFADGFPSGVMRLSFDKNGDLFVGQTGRGWRAQGGSEHALVVVTRSEVPLASELADITREGANFTLHFTQPVDPALVGADLRITSWTYLDSPNYGSPENDKGQLKISKMQFADDAQTLKVTLSEMPQLSKNRVFFFESKQLPATKGATCEAFYSIVAE